MESTRSEMPFKVLNTTTMAAVTTAITVMLMPVMMLMAFVLRPVELRVARR